MKACAVSVGGCHDCRGLWFKCSYRDDEKENKYGSG